MNPFMNPFIHPSIPSFLPSFLPSLLGESKLCGLYIYVAGSVDAAIAGLVLNYATDFTSYVTGMITSLASMEMSMNAVERVGEFCELPQEAPSIVEDCRPPNGWPSDGRIVADQLSL